MPTEMERLVVTLEASIKQYERALAKANGTTVKTLRKMENQIAQSEKLQARRFGAMGDAIGKRMGANIKAQITGALKGAFAGVALGQLPNVIGNAVKRLADLGDTAEDIGMSAESLQVWNRMAIEAGQSAETMAKGLYEIAEQGGDADSNLAKLFARFGQKPTGEVEQDMRTFVTILESAKTETQQLGILTEIFGKRTGRALAEALRGGLAKYDETLKRMIADQTLITNEGIQKAADLERAWNEAMAHLGARVSEVLLETSGSWDNFGAHAKAAIDTVMGPIRELIGLLQQIDQWMKDSGIDAWIRKYGPYGSATQGMPTPSAAPGLRTRRSTDDAFLASRGGTLEGIARLDPAFSSRLVRLMKAAELATGSQARLAGSDSLFRTFADQTRIYNSGVRPAARPGHSRHEIGRAADFAAGPARDWMRANAKLYGLDPLTGDPPHIQLLGGGAPAGAPAATITPTIAENIKRATDEHKKFTAAIKETAEAKDQSRLIDDDYSKNIEADTQALQELNDVFASAAGGLVSDLMNGVKAGEAFNRMLQNILGSLAQMAVQQVFSGGGAPGGLLGALFGGSLGSGVAAKGIPGLPGLQHGGRFKVKGAGGTDSQLVAFRATPGEEVNVMPRGLRRSGAGMPSINLSTSINVAGNADETTLRAMDRKLARHAIEQRKALERDWGVLSLRYSRLRAP